MTLGALDYLFGSILIIAALRCTYRGFVAEVIAVAAVGGGLLAAFIFSAPGAAIVAGGLGESPWNRVIAFLLIFLMVYLLLKIFEGLLYRILDSLRLENLDRALGFLLGLAEGLLVCLLVIYILQVQTFTDTTQLLEESLFVRTVSFLLPLIVPAGEETINTRRMIDDRV